MTDFLFSLFLTTHVRSFAEPDVSPPPPSELEDKHHVSSVLWLSLKNRRLRKLEWTRIIGLVSINVFNAIQIVYRPACFLSPEWRTKRESLSNDICASDVCYVFLTENTMWCFRGSSQQWMSQSSILINLTFALIMNVSHCSSFYLLFLNLSTRISLHLHPLFICLHSPHAALSFHPPALRSNTSYSVC